MFFTKVKPCSTWLSNFFSEKNLNNGKMKRNDSESAYMLGIFTIGFLFSLALFGLVCVDYSASQHLSFCVFWVLFCLVYVV